MKKKNEPLLELLFIGCHDQFRLLGFCALTQTVKRSLQDVEVSWLGMHLGPLSGAQTWRERGAERPLEPSVTEQESLMYVISLSKS